ncbi:MAG: hypothetical protein H7Y00_15050, partial [Fimbriimonadaceae bacterium]|nr:hypothetical protein [Chitinophagales bacterium]
MNFAFTLTLYFNLLVPSQEQFYFTHPDQIPVITIGGQEWTTTNWNFKTPKSFFYNNDSTLDKKYGRLYYYSNAVGATPPGFHLPTMDEWWQLINYLGGPNEAGKKMMEGGDSGLNLP